MARRFISTDTPIGAVRRYFGLKQHELSLFLDVGKAIIGHIEAGRRDLSFTLRHRLWPLTRHLPATPILPPDDEPLPATAPAPEAAPLAARRNYCRAKATVLRFELGKLTARAVYASRWQQVMPAVVADLAAPASPEDEDMNAAISRWVQTLARRFKPSHAARYHLLRLQAEAYETEAAALDALLFSTPRHGV
ncbi:hypothetical protein [Hymenobacter terrenus]|uniref:hypothetical protein n=1 Tax=Hymenobacter terrenus TaxID=1629124 RepID=UPI0006196131|nr:hypothetical protein [Hymenobacter terrenus]